MTTSITYVDTGSSAPAPTPTPTAASGGGSSAPAPTQTLELEMTYNSNEGQYNFSRTGGTLLDYDIIPTHGDYGTNVLVHTGDGAVEITIVKNFAGHPMEIYNLDTSNPNADPNDLAANQIHAGIVSAINSDLGSSSGLSTTFTMPSGTDSDKPYWCSVHNSMNGWFKGIADISIFV